MVSDVITRCMAVGVGGALGSIARYGLSLWGTTLEGRVPWGTFIANALGCLGMGVVMYLVVERETVPEGVRLLVAVGLLGGLTTFSTFSYEGLDLIRDGHWGTAALYTAVSLVAGLGSAAAGWFGTSLLVPVQ
jgi:CrcB protein